MRKFLIKVNGHSYEVEVEEKTGASQARESQAAPAASPGVSPATSAPQKGGPVSIDATEIRSPLPGIVLSVNVSVGAKVSRGDLLVLIEAMKMENEILSPRSGTVLSIAANRDSTVNTGDLLLTIG